MNDWLNTLLNGDYGPICPGAGTMVFIMMLAFAAGHFIGFIYMWTHKTISYSRTFVASLVVLPVLIAVMMVVMAGNLLVAFGLIAVFGVIRFRNVLKDTRDTMFILWAITEGLTVGTLRFSTALLGCAGVGLVFLYLRLTSFGTRHRYDAVVTFRLSGDLLAGKIALKQVLRQHASSSKLMHQRRATDGGVDMNYRLLFRDPTRIDELQSALSAAGGLSNIAVFIHDDEAEI